MISIHFVTPMGGSLACTFNRATLPFNHLSAECSTEGVSLSIGPVDFKKFPEVDFAVFANLPRIEHLPILRELAKRCDLIWQLDDNFWDVPPSNPHADNVGAVELAVLEECLDRSKFIWAATQPLADVVGRGDKTFVVPNLIDMDHYWPLDKPGQFDTILWSGSATHADDLELISSLPFSVPRDFLFFGDLPESLKTYSRITGKTTLRFGPSVPNVGFLSPVRYEDYHRTLGDLAEHVGVALLPLAPNEFNGCKTNLTFLTYAALGIPVIASDFGPYASSIQHGSTGLLVSDGNWGAMLDTPGDELHRMAVNAQKYIRENWGWRSQPGRAGWMKAILAAAEPSVYEVIWGSA
jgi:glycosyltransferase involved in cell wall biosynthesis